MSEARKTRKFHQGNPVADNEEEHSLARREFIEAGHDRAKQELVLKRYPFLAGYHWRKYAPDLKPDAVPEAGAPSQAEAEARGEA